MKRTYLYVFSMPTNTKQQLCIKPTGFLVIPCVVITGTGKCPLFLIILSPFSMANNSLPYQLVIVCLRCMFRTPCMLLLCSPMIAWISFSAQLKSLHRVSIAGNTDGFCIRLPPGP